MNAIENKSDKQLVSLAVRFNNAAYNAQEKLESEGLTKSQETTLNEKMELNEEKSRLCVEECLIRWYNAGHIGDWTTGYCQLAEVEASNYLDGILTTFDSLFTFVEGYC